MRRFTVQRALLVRFNSAAQYSTGAVSTSSTKITACGLPIFTQLTGTDSKADQDNMCQRIFISPCAGTNGISDGMKRGFYHIDGNQTVIQQLRLYNNPFGRFDQNFRFIRQTLIRDKTRAKQRAPLPHCSTSRPSALKMWYRKSTASKASSTPKLQSKPTPRGNLPVGQAATSQRIKVLIDGINHP